MRLDCGATGYCLPVVTGFKCSGHHHGSPSISLPRRWYQLSWQLPFVAGIGVAKQVLAKSDNMAVVATLKAGSCQDQTLMHLMRCLAAHFQTNIMAAHVPGKGRTTWQQMHCQVANTPFFSGLPHSVRRTHLPSHQLYWTCCSTAALTGHLPTPNVQVLFDRGLAISTSHTYQSAKRRYADFCTSARLTMLPLTEAILSMWSI